MAAIALVAGVAYLVWRLVFTSQGVSPPLFALLFLAEAFGVLTFSLLVLDAWRLDPTPRTTPHDVPVDILITTYNEDADIVEPTVVGALLVAGNTTIYLCDDGRREEMRSLAERYGIEYRTREDNRDAKAGNINAILPHLRGELLLILDADHVPSPDFLVATSGYFKDPLIALVQTAHSFRNHNSVMHDEEGRHEQSLFFDVLLPGRDRIETAFWCGSAAVLRTSALRDIGGMATSTSTEDFQTSLTLQVEGYKVRYHNEHLVQGLAPDNLAAYLIQRGRWAEGTLSAFKRSNRIPWNRSLSLVQRFSYTGSLFYYLSPYQRLAYSFNLVIVGLFGFVPVGYTGGWYAVAWSTWALLSLLAVTALERGSSQPFEGSRNLFAAMWVFIRATPALWSNKPVVFNVTPKNEIDLGGWSSVRLLTLPIVLGGVTALIVIGRLVDLAAQSIWNVHFLPPVTATGVYIITAFGTFEVVIIAMLVIRIWRRRQYRHLWRFPVALSGTVDGLPAQCLDLHQSGAAFLAPVQATQAGDEVPISVQCRLIGGGTEWAFGTLLVKSVRAASEAGASVRISGIVRWREPEDRTRVIETCYVVEPYAARTTFWMRQAPRLPVSIPGSLGSVPATCIDLSVQGAAFAVADGAWNIGDVIPVSLQVDQGLPVVGTFEVRSLADLADGQARVGGLTTWERTDWIQDYVATGFHVTPRKGAARA